MSALVYVISGFLGSGKTTLINKFLESAPLNTKIVVLVNEFGRISIDERVIKADPTNIVSLSGGCVCCSLSTELIASVRFVVDTLEPDIILIESTGLAMPQEISRQAVSPFFEGKVELGGIITLVDAAKMLTDEYPIIIEQLKEADFVVVNKIDLIDEATLADVREKVTRVTPLRSIIYETSFARVDFSEILCQRHSRTDNSERKPTLKGVDTTAGFATICYVKRSPTFIDRVVRLFTLHGDKIIRSKGFVLTEKGPVQLQFSLDGIEITEIQKPVGRTELVLIVRETDRNLIEDEVKKAFEE
jgi:G3E family GTPase